MFCLNFTLNMSSDPAVLSQKHYCHLLLGTTENLMKPEQCVDGLLMVTIGTDYFPVR